MLHKHILRICRRSRSLSAELASLNPTWKDNAGSSGFRCRIRENGVKPRWPRHAKPRATSASSPLAVLSASDRRKSLATQRVAQKAAPNTLLRWVWHAPRYAKKSGFAGCQFVDFADFFALTNGIGRESSQHVVGSHVFQDFAPRNGRAPFGSQIMIEMIRTIARSVAPLPILLGGICCCAWGQVAGLSTDLDGSTVSATA